MRPSVSALLPFALLVAALPRAHADEASEARLRDQLKQVITELRTLQDENTDLKIRLERAPKAAPVVVPAADPAELEALRAQLESQSTEAESLRQQLAQYAGFRDQAQKAIDQAHADARQQAEAAGAQAAAAQAAAAQLKACAADNATLVRISGELLDSYRGKGVVAALREREPLLGLQRVKLENLAQSYRNRIGDATVVPPAAAGAPEQAAVTPNHDQP